MFAWTDDQAFTFWMTVLQIGGGFAATFAGVWYGAKKAIEHAEAERRRHSRDDAIRRLRPLWDQAKKDIDETLERTQASLFGAAGAAWQAASGDVSNFVRLVPFGGVPAAKSANSLASFLQYSAHYLTEEPALVASLRAVITECEAVSVQFSTLDPSGTLDQARTITGRLHDRLAQAKAKLVPQVDQSLRKLADV